MIHLHLEFKHSEGMLDGDDKESDNSILDEAATAGGNFTSND